MNNQINQPPVNPDDEIDMGLFFRRLGRIFSGAGKGVSQSAGLILRRPVLIGLFLLFGIGAGTLLYYIATPVYKASMTLTSNVLSNDYCSDRIEDLQLVVKDRSYSLLAKKLQISQSTAEKIKMIAYAEIYEPDEKERDSIIIGIPFKVKLEVIDPVVIDSLQTALLNYLENNEYSLARKKIRRESMEQMREKLGKEITQLDCLKVIVANSLLTRQGSAGGIVIGQPLDPLNVYREDIILFQQKLGISSDLSLINNIQVIDGFLAREKPDSPKLLKNIVIFGAIFGLIGFIIAWRSEKRKPVPLQ
jgi:hypothetical protein